MKVIVAGMPKTGTKSMQAALTELGYKVYDYEENYLFLGKDWRRICLDGGSTEDFRRMYEDVDAVTDVPPCYFWDEIHKAFPDSKIILTMRDNEDMWMNSFRHQLREETQPIMLLLMHLSPSMHTMFSQGNDVVNAIFGTKVKTSLFGPSTLNELLLRMTYRRHNSYVMQAAPKDKLLIFNVKEGWEPLCKFLGVEVPDKPFPRKNVRGGLVNEALREHPFFQRCKREMIVSTLLLSLVVGYGGYKLFRKSTFSWIRSALSETCQFLQSKLPLVF